MKRYESGSKPQAWGIQSEKETEKGWDVPIHSARIAAPGISAAGAQSWTGLQGVPGWLQIRYQKPVSPILRYSELMTHRALRRS